MIVDIYEYFRNHPKFNKHIGNDFVLVEYKCPLNVEEFRLWTESHVITFVISGKKDWYTPTKTYSLTGGDALFIKKGIYTTKQYFEEDYCVMLFFINDNFIKTFVIENQIKPIQHPGNKSSERVIQIDTDKSFNLSIESIFHYLTKGQSIPQPLIELKFKELIFNIALNPLNQGFNQILLDIANTRKTDIEHIMNANFQYDLPLEAFAKLSGRSLSSFKRDFKTNFDTSPSKWLMAKRLDYGKMLLDSSQMNINEICYESGFKNTSHFIQSFKRQFKLTPNQYRASTK